MVSINAHTDIHTVCESQGKKPTVFLYGSPGTDGATQPLKGYGSVTDKHTNTHTFTQFHI